MPRLSDSLKQNLATRVALYSAQIDADSLTSRHGREYLRARVLARTDVVGPYRLGVVAEPLPGDEQFAGRLVIPYLTAAGVRGVKYRCLQDHDCKEEGHSKYTQPRGQHQRLYNTAACFGEHDVIGVCEGEIDAITATVHLGIPTVGVPGAAQWKKQGKHWQLALKDFGTVIVFADGDVPGRQLAGEIAADTGPGTRIVHCDDGADINSMVAAGLAGVLLRKAGVTQ